MRSATILQNRDNIKSSQQHYAAKLYPNKYSTSGMECNALDGLPAQFVNSMMTLFNMLDDAGTGLVPLVEIERRWREDAVPNLPGVLDALRNVAPPNGLLSFSNFVCGLRTALARSRRLANESQFYMKKNGDVPQQTIVQRPEPRVQYDRNDLFVPKSQTGGRSRRLRHRRSNSGPTASALGFPKRSSPTEMDVEVSAKLVGAKPMSPNTVLSDASGKDEKSDLDNLTANTLFVNPTEMSKPLNLSGKYIGIAGTLHRAKSTSTPHDASNSLSRPMKNMKNKQQQTKSASSFSLGIKTAAKNALVSKTSSSLPENRPVGTGISAQSTDRKRGVDDIRREITRNRSESRSPVEGISGRCNSYSPPERPLSKSARSSKANCNQDASYIKAIDNATTKTSTPQTEKELEIKNKQSSSVLPSTVRRRAANFNRRKDARRHTVTNGVDYNVLKCIKLLEQERDLLSQGIETTEKSRDVFQKKLNLVNEKYKFVTESGAVTSSKFSMSSYALSNSNSLHGMSSASKNLSEELWSTKSLSSTQTTISTLIYSVSALNSVHSSLTNNLSTKILDEIAPAEESIATIKDKNHFLMQEVVSQADKIDKLEQEKAMLVKQLFQTKAEAQGVVDTSIFI